jgi:hypothetical protein
VCFQDTIGSVVLLIVVGCGDGRATCVLWYPTGLIAYVIRLLSPQIMAHQIGGEMSRFLF